MTPTQAELEVTQRIIAGLREHGLEIVSRDLIGRISDYFHVNAKPTDDLAIGYMNALDAIILRGHSPLPSQGGKTAAPDNVGPSRNP